MAVADCSIVEWPEHRDARGALIAVQHPDQVPFDIARAFVVYDVPEGARRGGHAHRECHELLVAIGGQIEVTLWDGKDRRRVLLERPTQGLHLAPMTWLDIERISLGAVCLVLCSHPYDEDDYLRERDAFLAAGASE